MRDRSFYTKETRSTTKDLFITPGIKYTNKLKNNMNKKCVLKSVISTGYYKNFAHKY